MARIELADVGVHYTLSSGTPSSLMSSVKSLATGGQIKEQNGKFGVTALLPLSLALSDGDRLAIIGHNGAGKTTLLRLLSGILPPTSGRVRIEGRLSSLLSIHLGLNAEVSGYENIRRRAIYMGYTKNELKGAFDEIAIFSGLGDYLALPMRTYSSGMRLRLAFAIATAFKPSILILDEWLSAGDENFQAKAEQRMNALINETGIFAFATHSESLQSAVCNKGLVLHHGRMIFFGPLADAQAAVRELNREAVGEAL